MRLASIIDVFHGLSKLNNIFSAFGTSNGRQYRYHYHADKRMQHSLLPTGIVQTTKMSLATADALPHNRLQGLTLMMCDAWQSL
jgi:hypothetical protein